MIGNNWIICIIIIVLKILEITVYTYRVILTTKGKKIAVSILGGLNNGVSLVTNALTFLSGEGIIFRMLAFILGYIIGSYFGILIDEKLFASDEILNVVLEEKEGRKIALQLREIGYEVFLTRASGMNMKRAVLKIIVNKKQRVKLAQKIKELSTNGAVFMDENVQIIK